MTETLSEPGVEENFLGLIQGIRRPFSEVTLTVQMASFRRPGTGKGCPRRASRVLLSIVLEVLAEQSGKKTE